MKAQDCSHERASIEDSRFHGGGYATPESRRIFCDVCRLDRWLNIEAALAESQAELGLIPKQAAEKIRGAAKIELLDQNKIVRGIASTQHSLVPLLRALEPVAGSYASQYLHYGATTQDIQDTGQSLEIRDVLNATERDVIALLEILEPMAMEHKNQLMVGRTHAQPALPISFGLKVSTWIDELVRHLRRLQEARPRLLVAQLFGGVGTMAAFRGQGPALLEGFAKRLGLHVPLLAWHVSRDRVSEFIFIIAGIGATLARIADEVRTLSRKPYLELEEYWGAGQLGSSTMPHKRNPEKSEQIIVLARLARAQVGLGLEAMIVEHERDYRGTRLEWSAIPSASHYILTALSLAIGVLKDLVVHTDNMTRAAENRADAECTEALTFALGMRVGKAKAFHLVHKLSQQSTDRGESLRETALKNHELNSVMESARIAQIFDPSSYLGSSVELVERTVEASRIYREQITTEIQERKASGTP